MLKRYWLGTVLVFALVLSASCSTLNVGNSSPERDTAEAFSLNVMDESFFNGATVESITTTTKEGEDYYQVSINVEGAQDLKALYFSMNYNPDAVIPMGVVNSDLIASDEDRLTLTYEHERGVVYSGQLVANPDWHSGFSGDGTLATLNFVKRPTPLMRETSKVNTTVNGGALNIEWDGTDTLTWLYNNPADYDQNGEVGISDLTPLGINLNADASGATVEDSLSVVDGDGNGLVTLADITPIGVNFGNSCNGGYNVYAGNSADKPAGGDPDVVAVLENVPFNAATGTNLQRKRFTYTVAAPGAGDEYWVRGVSATGELGTPSDAVGGDPNEKPSIELDSPTPGGGGDGSQATPWIINSAAQAIADFTFSVYDTPNNGGAEITGNAGVTISSNPAGATTAIDQATGVVNFDDSFVDTTFYVSAVADGTETNKIYFRIEIAPAGLFIFKDDGDADWATVPGDGLTEPTAYVIATNSFNTDGLTEFSFIANTMSDASGDSIDVNTLTWGAGFEFMVTNGWSTPGTATFHEMFTNTYVFATDGDSNESNHIFVAAENLAE